LAPSVTTLGERIRESVEYLRAKGVIRPFAGLILGTGLGRLAESLQPEVQAVRDSRAEAGAGDASAVGRRPAGIAYDEIPHFPRSTVESHAGRLLTGVLGGHPVVAMQGRLHYYEGYSLEEVTYPVRVMRALGAELLILSNAAGGLNPLYELGDLMLIDDHINLMGENPLRGPNDETLGPRFPDLSQAYDRGLIATAERVALEQGLRVRRGVYVAVAGPMLETRAEYRFLRMAGADAVGMSTVPEVIVANHAGMRVLAISVITDRCLPDALEPVSVPEIIRIAGEAEPRLARLVECTLRGVDPPDPR
jgi:purine-nucleoside phosphorylase